MQTSGHILVTFFHVLPRRPLKASLSKTPGHGESLSVSPTCYLFLQDAFCPPQVACSPLLLPGPRGPRTHSLEVTQTFPVLLIYGHRESLYFSVPCEFPKGECVLVPSWSAEFLVWDSLGHCLAEHSVLAEGFSLCSPVQLPLVMCGY